MGRVGISRLCHAGFMTDESSRPYRIEDLIRVRLRDLKTAACGIEVVYHARIAEEGGCYGRRHRHHDDPPASPCVRGCKPTGRTLSDDKREAGAAHKVAEEFGVLLFVMANVACHLRIDPEALARRQREVCAAVSQHRSGHSRRGPDARGRDVGGNGAVLGLASPPRSS
jgi:hypothetical protein